MPFELRYHPDSPLGAKFPLWRFGQRTTRESADATRMQCANPDQIEVVECVNGPTNKGESGTQYETISGYESGPETAVTVRGPRPLPTKDK